MRAVIQRVREATVMIDDKIKSAIGSGLLVLLGIEAADTEEDMIWLSQKICHMRIFDDADGIMNCSVKTLDGSILLVSQFTLYASTKKGNRPGYSAAARPEIAIPFYEKMIRQLEYDLGKAIATGSFGADMKIQLVNDGPVTIIVDTKRRE